MEVANRLREMIENFDWQLKNHNVKITASFGLAQWHENESASIVFNNADKALYKAKRSGKNQIVISS